jgi:hypothetical protein
LTVAGIGALARLALARARRRPVGWLLSVIGIAVTLGYAGAVVAASTIAADRSARAVLRAVPDSDRAVRLTWQAVVTPRVRTEALALFRRLELPRPAEVVLMNPVRLSGTVVRPVGITPLRAWVAPVGAAAACTPRACPVLVASATGRPSGPIGVGSALTAPSVRLTVTGTTGLRSALPLGFVPLAGTSTPVLLTGDAHGLDALGGLDAIYRTDSWVTPLDVSALHAWQLAPLARRLRAAQQQLLASNSAFGMGAPFTAIATARSEAAGTPHRLWLAGGGAAAALIMFVVLAAGALRRDRDADLERLRNAGARRGQLVLFVTIEAGLLSAVAVLAGAGAGIAAGAVLAHLAGTSAGAVLVHSLITPGWIAVLATSWLLSTVLLAGSAAVRSGQIADALAVAAVAAIALALAVDNDATGRDPLTVLLAPLCALAGGVLVFRVASGVLRSAERAARRGPVMVRLALVGLARAPTAPALAAAFLAVSIGLGGFALSYRATLLRGAADQAANRVPLDGLIAPGPDFTRPLVVSTLTDWRRAVGGAVWPVRRTEASYVAGGSSVTVAALGVPAAALPDVHGWRTSDGPAPLTTLAHRLVPAGPLRTPGPSVPPLQRFLTITVDSPALALDLTAVLRSPGGGLRRLGLGQSDAGATPLRARLPPGRWELFGFDLREGAGLEATNGHQNAENPAANTQFTATVRLGPVDVAGARIGAWRGVGAITAVRPQGGRDAVIRFATTSVSGFLRPAQPSDTHPVPVLVGPGVPNGRRLALTVDGQPVSARAVGVVRRFPTIGGGGGFVVADEPTLAAALDAQTPGEGTSDELWQQGGHRAAPFPGLTYSWRADVERGLRGAPVARAILGTMVAAAALAGVLALAGLLIALLGSVRDRRIELDLVAQGLSPREVRAELRLRIALAAALGVLAGLAIAVVLTVLALAAVRAGLGAAVPQPPLITVAPWAELAGLAVAALAACGLASVLGTASSGAAR